jgi:hypothetical protein
MKNILATALVGAAVALMPVAASAQYGVPVYPGPNPQRSSQFCDNYARDWANWATQRGNDAAVGLIIGGGLGAFWGEVLFNRPGLGGLIGGGIGLGIGAFADRPEWRQQYENAYNACINGGPLAYPWFYNFDGGRYVAGSAEWYQWCQMTYGIYFDPATGYWRAANGQTYPCVVP